MIMMVEMILLGYFEVRESEKVINVGEKEKMSLIFEQVLRDGPSKFGCMQNGALVARTLNFEENSKSKFLLSISSCLVL